MTPLTIIAFPTAAAGREDELAAQFAALVPATLAEPGCLGFVVHRDAQAPQRFAVYETFRDQAAFDAHLAMPHTQRFVAWIEGGGATLAFQQWQRLDFAAPA